MHTLHAFVYGAAAPAEAAPAAADAACIGADLALMADMTTTNAMTILPKMEGGLTGKCGSCIMANSAGGADSVAAACTAGQQHDKLCQLLPSPSPLPPLRLPQHKHPSEEAGPSDRCAMPS